MKPIFGLVTLLLFWSGVHGQSFFGAEANELVTGAQEVRIKKAKSIPSHVTLAPGQGVPLEQFEAYYQKVARWDSSVQLRLIGVHHDQIGMEHHRFQQFFGSIPVEFAVVIAHVREGEVLSYTSEVYPLEELNVVPEVTAESALKLSLQYMGAEAYRWQDKEVEDPLLRPKGPNSSYFPASELVILPLNGKLYPCYKIDVYATQPVSRKEVFIDAITGDVLFEDLITKDVNTVATVETAYSGIRTMTVDSTGTDYRLGDNARGGGIRTLDMQNGMDYAAAQEITSADNSWSELTTFTDRCALDAHWGAQMTYDYFFENFGRESVDDNGTPLTSYVHFGDNFNNAFWDGQAMTYGDGSGNNAPLTPLDVVGHEFTHGVTDFSANLIYFDESGALNESFSDIFGTLIEFHAFGDHGDWLIGEDLPFTIRDMQNPNQFGDPNTYKGNFWQFSFDDNGGVHTNSGVQNYWFYLLAEGGSGTNDLGEDYNVEGIGLEKAAAIAYRNLNVYLTPGSNYADARFFAVQAATDLYGPCSPEVASVTNAWHAVGLGDVYLPEVNAEFTASITDACAAPFQVDFKNRSQNGLSYTWDFGDGTTSTGYAPSHLYTTYGDFDVKLVVDGGSCGVDSVTVQDYIHIDSTFDCVVFMPVSGVGITQTACTGKLYDSGGPDGNYPDQRDASITIDPADGGDVLLLVNFFDVEEGDDGTCNYDKLYVYDGPSSGSDLIGIYCNTTGIPDTLRSTNGPITVRLFSDQALNLKGFDIDWQCTSPQVLPEAAFDVDLSVSCDGTVQFTDRSLNLPTSWFWDFGDGDTSNVQSPEHTYEEEGAYSVTLKATNGVGSDEYVKTDVIQVAFPAPFEALGDSVCAGESASLSATGPSNFNWYASSEDVYPLDSGTPYLTVPLDETTRYLVASRATFSSQQVGPETNTFGGGGFFSGDQHLLFDAIQDLEIRSVKVYAGSAGARTVELRKSDGSVLASKTVMLQEGEQRITLGFEVPQGQVYQLGTSSGSSPDLFRNNNATIFPFLLEGLVAITGTSADQDGFYYFYYDWEVAKRDCESEREEVIAVVDCLLGQNETDESFSVLTVTPNPAGAEVMIFSEQKQDVFIEIFDITGSKVFAGCMNKGALSLNVASWKSGLYVLRGEMEGRTFTTEFIVQ